MKVLDNGHLYSLDTYDGDSTQELRFMKREGEGYPGNVGSYSGTNCQEVIRVLIDRVLYLDNQIPHLKNQAILQGLRQALLAFELRAIERHGNIENMRTCRRCGHVACEHHDG